MSNDTMFYLTATIVSLVLALQLTHFWLNRDRDPTIAYWVVASWMFVASDTMFTLRSVLPPLAVRVIPSLLVTAAYGTLLLGSQRTAGLKIRAPLVLTAIFLHGLGLLLIFDKLEFPNGRAIFNRVIWGGFCFACFFCLKKTSRYFWASINTPAAIFLIQGIWLAARMVVAGMISSLGWSNWLPTLQYLDYINVILFDGTLFVALLLALLHLRQDEATSARAEMQTLTGLLPVCAWCKKVRDDEGYWREVTEYFAQKNLMKITHGMCQSCGDKMRMEEA